MAQQIHVNDQHAQQIRRGRLGGAEEPELVNIKDLEADDIVIAYVIKVFQGECLTRYF